MSNTDNTRSAGGAPSSDRGSNQPRSDQIGVRAAASRVVGRGGSRLGLIVIAVGLVVIGIGWNGAAGSGGEVNHVPVVQAQLPWILSGGFLGLGIIVLGAAMVIANAYRESEARLSARFEQLLETLAEGNGAALPGTPRSPCEPIGDLVVAGSTSFHRPDCRLVKGRTEARTIEVSTALDLGLNPCRICRPLDAQSRDWQPAGKLNSTTRS
jgi:hypothetical protein